jgi:hypothetical protein
MTYLSNEKQRNSLLVKKKSFIGSAIGLILTYNILFLNTFEYISYFQVLISINYLYKHSTWTLARQCLGALC